MPRIICNQKNYAHYVSEVGQYLTLMFIPLKTAETVYKRPLSHLFAIDLALICPQLT